MKTSSSKILLQKSSGFHKIQNVPHVQSLENKHSIFDINNEQEPMSSGSEQGKKAAKINHHQKTYNKQRNI